jgi:glycosyltransferase involved in cell wall biosynthesis
MASPIVSVIVPTRNRHHLLPRALGSLFAQTLPDFEIVVVDDNEPGNRVGAQPTLAAILKDPRVRVVEHDCPRNAASARNCGLRSSRGQWITYLDDDDAYHPAKLEKQLRAAERSGLPLGLCGMAVNLPGRRRLRQVGCDSFVGAELLLSAISGTVFIFHQKTQPVFFNEDLGAAEDAYFFFTLVRHFGIDRVFNVAEPLVEIYPQAGARVNLNGLALWQASLAIYREFAPAFGEKAASAYLTRAELQYCKFRPGGLRSMPGLAVRLLRVRGWREWRLILNAFLFKLPLTRRFVVS